MGAKATLRISILAFNTSMEAILLIGIPGAGKTTYYQAHFAGMHAHINLDTLKTRPREAARLRACIAAGESFVVDNTNVQRRERARYIDLAKSAGYRVIGYYFPISPQSALRRNAQRAGRGRIPSKGVWARYRLLEPPTLEEGFDELYVIEAEQPA
jgi:predicted kinase